MTNNWNIASLSEEEEVLADHLARELNLTAIVGRLLVLRGITSVEEAQEYFHPSLSKLHDPFLMRDMDLAVKRLNKAVGNKERILIYGDYDVDGTTAVTLVYKFLRSTVCSHDELNYYIPDRYEEGYGISYRGIDFAHEWGARLIIVLDCGIKAIEKVAYAKSLGIDFIICDHHNPDEVLPDAVAVLDAKRTDNTYPFEHLSGCGVGFKLLQAFAQSNNIDMKKLYCHLDLLAVSIAADIVPLVGENRILAYYGIKQLNTHPSLGLKGIIKTSGLDGKPIDMDSIVFKIGPRINASGRMMNGREAVDLLLASDKDSARKQSAHINEYNLERRKLDRVTTEEALLQLKEDAELENRKILVLYSPEWHKGVIGIVASRITERYYRPTIVLTRSGDHISGSARSLGGFDVYKAIEYCKDFLVNFGGHTYAAGLTIKPDFLNDFIERIRSYAETAMEPEVLVPQIDIDAEISLHDITPRLMREIKSMAPFGSGNEKPVFVSRHAVNAGRTRAVGAHDEHLRLDITNQENTIKPINGIAFQLAKKNLHYIQQKKPFSLVYTIEENNYHSNSFMQLQVKDIALER
ncbi:recombinase RecJ [Porphyromonas macacae]|uniref:Single-stranded-DNA-specific exonuclease RecJ n=2 Tax=Porphyromonas macacae TaxID=28115 RepID=A0A0A2GJH1_9PORP|nr:single-stranded-DNA-specific exonuclease RecJ [Porphyromonas macacae]KGN75623.1 recombinase RecJ [Porphyromonas macacae]KGO00650.1 recombinase RecJ [Porphyromonas macacae]SUB77761.1 Single-stranded-DNA-specific exonuclease recJ [Porphyromonas macacae]